MNIIFNLKRRYVFDGTYLIICSINGVKYHFHSYRINRSLEWYSNWCISVIKNIFFATLVLRS